jgi:hypothetical protein
MPAGAFLLGLDRCVSQFALSLLFGLLLSSLSFLSLLLLGFLALLLLQFLLFALLALNFGLPFSLLFETPLLLSFLSHTLLFLSLSLGLPLLPLFFALQPLFFELLFLRSLGRSLLGRLFGVPASFLLILGLFLLLLFVFLLLCLSSFLGVLLLFSGFFFHQLLNELFLTLLGNLLSICSHDSLLEHPRSKNLEHSPAFLHALFFRHGILLVVNIRTARNRSKTPRTHHFVFIILILLLGIVLLVFLVIVVLVVEGAMIVTSMEGLMSGGYPVLRILFSLHSPFG